MQDGRGSSRPHASASSTRSTHTFQDPEWTYSCIKLQVDNIVFSVPKHRFLVSGSPFKIIFSGWDGKTPIVLEGASAPKFEGIFESPLSRSRCPTSAEGWLGALRLANKWKFDKVVVSELDSICNPYDVLQRRQIRDKAVKCLNTYVSGVPAYTKISLGQRYLNEIWLRDGLVELAQDRSLNIHRLSKPPYSMDSSTIAQILYVQSQAALKVVRHMETCHVFGVGVGFRGGFGVGCSLTDHASYFLADTRALVDQVFDQEIKAARYTPNRAGQRTQQSSSQRRQSS